MSKLTKRGVDCHFVILAIITVLVVLFGGDSQASQGQLRKTVGRFWGMSCSSKDCVVYVKPPGMKEMGFMMYGECDDREFGASSRDTSKYKGRQVEVISWKNRHRAELEIIKSIRFIKKPAKIEMTPVPR